MRRFTARCCASHAIVIFAVCCLALPAAAQNCGPQLTDDNLNQKWGKRHSTSSGARVLWFDDNQDVSLGDVANVVPVQAGDPGEPSLGSIDDVVFALGSGSTPGQVIGAWRRGTDFAWVTVNGNPPTLVVATNPITANDPLNPEGVAIADGCVFMVLQAFAGGQAVKHVFQVDPATGSAVNLTGSDPVPGVSGRIRTSGCRAAWGFDVGDALNPDVRLQFFDGATVQELGKGAPSDLVAGRLIWIEKDTANVDQIMLYDSNLPAATPTPITARTDGTRPILFAQTDGRHVAWIESGVNFQDRRLMLLGGFERSDASTRPANTPPNVEFPFQLRRGQLLWTSQDGKTHHDDGYAVQEVCSDGWLADGFLAQLLTPAGQADTEVFLRQLTSPFEDPTAPFVLQAQPGSSGADLAWDQILGASSYHLYVAEQPGVTPANYTTLLGGRRIVSSSNSVHVGCLRNNRPHYAAVAAVIDGVEGHLSREITFTPRPTWTKGQAAQGALLPPFRAVTADIGAPATLYAAGSDTVYRSSDDGVTWTPLAGGIENHTIRALGAAGPNVYAVTQQGDVYRSTNAGADWQLVLDGEDLGEQRKSLLIDPQSPNIIYAANLKLPTMVEPDDAFIVGSTASGDPGTWTHLPEFPNNEIRAYAMEMTATGTLLAGGSGTPALASTPDAGVNWTDLQFPPGYAVYSLAVTPTAGVIYGGSLDAVYRTENNGADWTFAGSGLPAGSFINALRIDPAFPATVYAGTDSGFFVSTDAGQHWTSFDRGLDDPVVFVHALALTPSGSLVATAADGLWRLRIAPDNQPADSPDTDKDGLVDCYDACPADPGKIVPGLCGCGVADTDTDQDTTPDCQDACPNDPTKTLPDLCGCGAPDADSDTDSVPDCNDACPNNPQKTAPGACGCGVPDTDTDGDTTPDCNDACPGDARKTAPGTCGCGVPETDSDADGTLDCVEGCPDNAGKATPGQCGCATPDTDSDADGVADCNDACPNDAAKIAPGACGCGVPDTNRDADSIPDCRDNCPDTPNEDQADANQDGVGDACASAGGGGDGSGGGGSGGGGAAGGANGQTGGDTNVVTPDGGQSGQSGGALNGQDTQTSPTPQCGSGACGAGSASALPLMMVSLTLPSLRRRTSRNREKHANRQRQPGETTNDAPPRTGD